MTATLPEFDGRKVTKVFAAVLVGLAVGSMVPPEPVVLPVVGSVSSLVVGGVGVAVGALVYARVPGSSGCGCSGDCDC